MREILIISIAGVLGIIAVVVVIINTIRTRKTFDRLDKMTDDAINGQFTPDTYDESRLSALETRFHQYISATKVSAEGAGTERDKIKSLISDISHQTKTPISNLLLYSELVLEKELPDEVRDEVEAIRRQTETLRFLIDSLVKLSRMENGIITLSANKEPLMPLFEEIGERYSDAAAAKGIEFIIKDTGIPAVFDRKWTMEAVGNIVDNAIKYTDSGSISISAVPYELFIRIDISDTGIGIPEDEIPRVFGRFYRAESAKEQMGSGLGLYLAREIISKEGGYIKVSSAPGQGSTFSVFLPR